MLTQGTRSATEYIEKFDEFLTRCSEFVDESPIVTRSRFRFGLRDDLRKELFTRGISDLEHAYQIVRDLDASRGTYYQRCSDYKNQGAKPPLDSPSSNSVLIVRSQQEISRVKAQLRACDEPTPAPNVLSVKGMGT